MMVRKFLPLLVLTVALALPASMHAQITTTSVREQVPPFELYGGYSYVFSETSNSLHQVSTNGLTGWDTSFKVPLPILPDWLGIKGDVSGNYYKHNRFEPNFTPKAYYFMLGPQVSAHLGRSTVFLHGLVGSAHVSQNALPNLRTANTLAVAVGGGLDAGFSRHWAWRITGDYYNTRYRANDNNLDAVLNSNGRVATGPLFRF